MSDRTPASELRETWERAAPGWAKWEHVVSAGLSDPTEKLFDMAGIGPGMRVLDVACGAGSQSLQCAKRVGPTGKVVATDLSPTMLDHVRRNATRAGLQNIETMEKAADAVGDIQPPFDAAFSRLGLMLFLTPRKALDAVLSALKPGARFAALVFTTPAENAFMAKPMAILLRHAGKAPPAPGQPGIFALGDEGSLQKLIEDAGYVDVKTRTVGARLNLASVSEALTMMQEAFGAYRAVVADLGPGERAAAWDEVEACLAEFEAGGGFTAELEFLIASGARPT